MATPTPAAKLKAKAKTKAKAKATPNALPRQKPAVSGSAALPKSRDRVQPLRASAASTGVVSMAERAIDPMVLGALALLTLVLSSAALLLVLQRSVRHGVRA